MINIVFTSPCRYNINGFVEELPQLPESRYRHSCAALPSTGVRLGLDQPLKSFQAFVVAGGRDDGSNSLSSVVTLLPGATTWTPLASLPRSLSLARASIVAGGRMRVVGGSRRSEVTFPSLTTNNNLLSGRCSSITLHLGTSGWPLEIFKLQDTPTLFFLSDLNSCLVWQVTTKSQRKCRPHHHRFHHP